VQPYLAKGFGNAQRNCLAAQVGARQVVIGTAVYCLAHMLHSG
jgi:hypothetical protein